MATRELKGNSEGNLTSGSEAVFDHVCQPCWDEKIREAAGFCVDCAEWLCEECFTFHKKPKPSRHHVLMQLAEMQKLKFPLRSADTCTEKCTKHSGKRLKYYCPVHDFVGCSLCVIQGHGSCGVDHIPDICDSTAIQDEFQQLKARLYVLAKESRDNIGLAKELEETVKIKKAEAIQASQICIQKSTHSLDVAGVAIKETCEKQADEETKKLENVAGKCKAVDRESLHIKAHLEGLKNSGQLCNTFIAVKQSRAKLTTLEGKLEDAKRSLSVKTYMFKPTMAVESIINGSDGIGTLVDHYSRKNMCRDYSNVQARPVVDIFVNEGSPCSIISSVLLSPHKLLLADFDNKRVLVIDTRTNEMVSHYDVDGKPWGMCKASDTSVAVTLYDKSKILFLLVNGKDKLSLEKALQVRGRCRGVAIIDNKMLVTFVDPAKLKIMDIGGTVLQTISDPKIVHSPCHIAVSSDNTSVYISNFRNNTVTCTNLEGTLIATYKDRKLRGPEQITIDSNGMVFVGGHESNNVHLLMPNCEKVDIILQNLEKVLALSYCEQTDRMYIGMGECDVVRVYKLSY